MKTTAALARFLDLLQDIERFLDQALLCRHRWRLFLGGRPNMQIAKQQICDLILLEDFVWNHDQLWLQVRG